jgi:hypothetical protein
MQREHRRPDVRRQHHSISGNYWFNPANNRAIALHPAIIREAFDKVYGAKALLEEMSRP